MSLKHIQFGITIIAITIASFFLPTRLANEKSSIVHEGFSKILIYGTFKRQIDPTQVFNPAFLAVLACSFDSLTSISHSGEIQGELVRSWAISPDAKTYEFELAPTKFWDGSTVTSLEVEKSFKRYLSPSSTAVHKELLRSILLDHDWFIKIGKNKFRVRLKRSFPEFLYLMSMADLSIFKIDKFKNIIGTGAYKIAMDSEKNLKLISIRGQKEASVDFVYEKISSGRDISLGQYDYFLGFPPLWSEFLQIPSTHSISFSKRYNIISIQLNPDRQAFKIDGFRHDIEKLFIGIRNRSQYQRHLFEPYDSIIPQGIFPPSAYRLASTQGEIDPEDFIEKWRTLIAKNSFSIWLPSAYFPPSFVSAVKSVFAKIPRSRILTGKFWEIVEEFRSGNIDISAIDSGTHIPSLEGLITIWEANSLPGFSFPGSNLVKQIKKNLDINNGIVGQETINLVSKFEKTSWIIPLYRTPRVAIFRKTMSYFDQEFSMQNTICE